MEISLFFKGLVLGFSIAAPVGPIAILCIRRTVQFGRLSGLFSGLGAAAADTFYALIAALGLTFISNFLMGCQFWLRLLGGVFLLYLGWRTFFNKSREKLPTMSHTTVVNDFISTFFLTVANPLTVLSFLAIFAGLGISDLKGNYGEALLLVIGVFLGSSLWWLILSEGVTLFRKKISQEIMAWINRIAGILIAGFGVLVLLTLIF